MKLADIAKLCGEATPGPWRWLGHDIGDTPSGRQWFWITDDSGETQLTNQSPGEVIFDIASPSAVVRSVSTGYGGETDVEIKDADKAFISASRTLMPLLQKAVEVAQERISAAIDMGINPLFFEEFDKALAAVEAAE